MKKRKDCAEEGITYACMHRKNGETMCPKR
jgi:hypothetical protein